MGLDGGGEGEGGRGATDVHLLLLLRQEGGRGRSRSRGRGRGRGSATCVASQGSKVPCCSGLSNKERHWIQRLLLLLLLLLLLMMMMMMTIVMIMIMMLLHACDLLPLTIGTQLQLRELRIAARQLQLQATVLSVKVRIFRCHDGESSLAFCLELNQLHLHLLQRFSQHARLLHPLKGGSLQCLRPPHPLPLRRHSRAPPHPLAQRPPLLLLPLLLRAPLSRLLLHVCRRPHMLHTCELVLLD